MSDNDLALTAHLMRRAGFGATRQELEELSTRSYESLVDDLLNPERFPEIEEDVLDRYYPEITIHNNPGTWLYRMINTKRPLEEKMVLFLQSRPGDGVLEGRGAVFAPGPARPVPPHRADRLANVSWSRCPGTR